MNYLDILKRGLITGAAQSVTITATLLAASALEQGKPWAAVNQICHMIDGEEAVYGDDFDARDSLLGVALNASSVMFWSVLYQAVFGRTRWPKSLVTGAAAAATAYTVDYHIVPRRLVPGFEKKISGRGIAALYVVLGLTFAAMGRKD